MIRGERVRKLCNAGRRAASTHTRSSNALTLLHKTESLIPRALSAENLAFWRRIFDTTHRRLAGSDNEPVNIAVYPVDKWAKQDARALVTALLHEPFASDDSANRALHSRAPSGVIEYGLTASNNTPTSLHIPSTYLSQFTPPLRICELDSRPEASSAALETLARLYEADIPVIVCNPLTSITVPDLKGALVVFVTSSTTPEIEAHLTSKLKESTIVYVDPSRALRGLAAFEAGSSSSAVQKYQDDFNGSQLSGITAALRSIVSPSDSSSTSFRERAALEDIASCLRACGLSLAAARDEVTVVMEGVDDLRTTVERTREEEMNAHAVFSGELDVPQAISQSEKEIRSVLDQLTLWRLVWRVGVDDVGEVISAHIRRSWCRGLEDELILHTGRLVALRRMLTKSSFDLINMPPPSSPLHSIILHNSLLQIAEVTSAPSRTITAVPASRGPILSSSSLTQPIHARRSQLISFPTTRLHVAAQHAVFSVFGGIGSGAAVGTWYEFSSASWFGNEVGVGAGLATGIALVGVRWGLGVWARAKREWWSDWRRIGEGLERDLKASLSRTLEDIVFLVPKKACDGMEELADRRRADIQEVRDDIQAIEQELPESRDNSI